MAPALVQAAALALRASGTICPASPTCPQNDKCLFSANGLTLEVNCATDYYGGDLQLARTSTLAACMKACSSTNGCVAVSYVGENCYMKSTLNSAQANNGVIGAYVTTRETKPIVPQPTEQVCPTSYTCPENDGCTFTGTDTRTFSLSCGVDFYGGDLTSLYAASLASCTQACSENALCIAASFVGGSGAGPCYLKDKNNGKTVNDNVDGISLISRVTPSPSATPSNAPSSAVPSTPVVSTQPTPTPIVTPPTQIVVNPSFEAGDGTNPTDWTVERLYIIDSDASGRFPINSRTGSYSIRGRGIPNGGYEVWLSQTVTVVPGASYNIEVFARETTAGFCSISIYLGDRTVSEYARVGTSYTSISALVDIPSADSAQQNLLVIGLCSLPGGNPEMYDLFMDDVTMSLVT